MKTNDIPQPWGEYLLLQAQVARSTRENCRSRGEDDALTDLLERIATASCAASLPVSAANLVDNRSLNHRLRRKIERRHAVELAPGDTTLDVVRELAHAQAVQHVRASLNGDDWNLLHDLSHGATFASVAEARGGSISTVKARACRIRKHLRDGELGVSLLDALAA